MDLFGFFMASVILYPMLMTLLYTDATNRGSPYTYKIKLKILIVCVFMIFFIPCYYGYQQALERKETAINEINKIKEYQCEYYFIGTESCPGDCIIVNFNLIYDKIIKEYWVECTWASPCDLPEKTTNISCYFPHDYNKFTYVKPEATYVNPLNLLVLMIVEAVSFNLMVIVEIITAIKKHIYRRKNRLLNSVNNSRIINHGSSQIVSNNT